jgi:hypothetical protein
VLLDVRFLVECVSSPAWAWTARAVDDLLGRFGLTEVLARRQGNKRQFKAANGLLCSVVADDVTREPVRIEFPFEVPPMSGVPQPELVEAYFAMLCAAVEGALGNAIPNPKAIIESGLPATGQASWPLPFCTMAVEVPGATGEFGGVLLSLSKQAVEFGVK